ncbi:MAG: cytochrome b N-terminal domain-containing protein [Planctomycetia bacterium]|nr:cytochrome b N-terminal domain-containing protein [Planctomycetia bacterium]
MKFLDWLEERTGLCTVGKKIARWQSPSGKFCCRFLPTSLIFLFILQAVTGVFLWAFYSASATSAWESVFYIQYIAPCGWFVRGVHHYSAQVFVGVSFFYVLCLILHGSYRRPREFVYWTALVTFLLSLCSCLTGDLLSWSQSGYFATITRVSFLQLIPKIGPALYQLVAGGPDPQFGSLTLTRFLFLHVCIFGGGGLVMLVLWKYFDIRSRRLFSSCTKFDGIHKCCLACSSKEKKAFWGCDAFLSGLTCLIVFCVVLLLVFQRSLTSEQLASRASTLPAESYLGAELTAPVDVSGSYDAARPEWSFRALYHMTKAPIFSKIGMFYAIFGVPPLLALFFFALPILGRNKQLHYLCVAITAFLFVVTCVFTYRSYWDDYKNPEHAPGFLASVAEAERTAERAVELAMAPSGIPKTGALTLTQSDPYLQGPTLFAQHCASCHNFTAPSEDRLDPDYVQIECSEPTAPNLYGAHTAAWIRGFTNEATLADADCFGNTAFAEKGSMVGFMQGRVHGGRDLEDGSFMLNSNGLIAKVIAADASAAYDILESVFEDFCDDDDNLALLEKIFNEDEEYSDEEVEAAQIAYVAKLRELIESKFSDEDFMSELEPQLPGAVVVALRDVLLDMLTDEDYLELLLDEDAIELVKDEDYDEFLTETYLATLNGNNEPIPSDALGYINRIRESIVESCNEIANVLAAEAQLSEPRFFVGGEYVGLAPNAIPDMDFLTCTECHAFYGTENDHACDLRAYMSRDWIAGFIADPTNVKYYGAKNDRMPSYCPEEGDALMTPEEVDLLADWLSGQWYRAPKLDNSSRIGQTGAAKAAAMAQQEVLAAEAAEASAVIATLRAQAAQEEAERVALAEQKANEAKAKAEAQAKEKAQKEKDEKTQLESQVKELTGALKEAQEKSEAEVKALREELEATKKELDTTRGAATEAATQAREDATEANARITAAEQDRDAAIRKQQDLQTQLDQSVARAQAALANEYKLRIDEQTAANQERTALQTQASDLRQQLASQTETSQTRIEALQDQVQRAENARQTAETRVGELNTAVESLRSQITALETELNALKASGTSEE